MTKGKHEFYILLKDAERNCFAATGPMQMHLLDDWYVAADARSVLAVEVRPEDFEAQRRFLLDNGWKEVDPARLVIEPIDRANHYVGKLPTYASDADRSKVITILCRDCREERLAVLNEPFPGIERLKAASATEYRATCLKCGYTAADSYNWYRA